VTALRFIVVLALLSALAPAVAAAQEPAAPPAADDSDRDPNAAQPDFTIVNLPTTLRLPRFKSAFRVTHRFTRPLGQGDFGDLADDLFGLDNGALIGLEYRFGLMSGLQAGILRTNFDKTIEFFGQYNLLNQRSGGAVGIGVIGSIEGINNFRDNYSPSLGVAVSREFGDNGAVYVEPIWVNNANPEPGELSDEDNDTFLIALGARLRIRPTVYIVGEFNGRAAGYSPGAHQGSFAIEKRAGGHVFQLNFSNGFGNTIGQLARGGTSSDDWYLGFNISRKFF
jgi:hypothetical protein